jgi:Spy/CpxP family protein refolding chaperone
MTDAISWRNPKVLRVLSLVFVAGGLCGAVTFRTARILMRRDPPVTFPSGGGSTSLREKEKAMSLLQRELNLTPAQSDKVSAIIDDYKRYYGNIQDQVEEVRATGKNRILEVLDPQQRTKFEKLAEGLK